MPPQHQRADHRPPAPPPELTRKQIEALEAMYGNRYLLEPAPDNKLPKTGMTAEEAMGLIERGDGARRPADAQPRDVRDHLDGARGRASDPGSRCA